MKIKLETRVYKAMRYPTCGDWIVKNGKLDSIVVADMGNEDYAFLVAIHEAIEAWLCLRKGVTQGIVDKFDMEYEEARESGFKAPCGCTPTKTSEPGQDKHAPYRNEHEFATKIERMLCKKLGLNWAKYSNVVESL